MKSTVIPFKRWLWLGLAIACCMQNAIAGTILVTNVLSNSLSLVDDNTLNSIAEIKVGYMPHEVVVTPNQRLAVVSNYGDILNVIPGHSLSVIDIAQSKLLRTIELPAKSRPHGIASLNNALMLVTAEGLQSLLIVDIDKGKVIKTLKLPGKGAHIVITDAAKRFAYVANTQSGSVCKIDLIRFAVIGEVKMGKEAEGLALTKAEDDLLVTNRKENYVGIIHTADLSLHNKIKTDLGPVRVSLFNYGQSALVTNTLSGTLQVIDLNSNAITKTYSTTQLKLPLSVPINILITPDQTHAYVTNSFACNTILVDLVSGKIIETISTALMPDGIASSTVDVSFGSRNLANATYRAEPELIHADIEKVWEIVKHVEDYNRLSHGAVTATLDGPLAAGSKITLSLYKDSPIGMLIPNSTEIITVVDDQLKIIGWARKLPDGNYTERYQQLIKLSNQETQSIITIKIPGAFGMLSQVTMGKTINNALTALNNGIKKEAEKI